MLMRLRLRRGGGPRQAITDVYDERRGAFLVQYPVWLILGIGLAGVAAFALTGFLDGQPLILYLWLCALVITLQASIFRHATMRARLIATLIVTALSILIVGFGQFGNLLPEGIKQSINYGELANTLANSTLTYSVLNFGVLAIFWVDTVRRWVRRARGLPPNQRVALTQEEERQNQAQALRDMPSLEELVSGDLIAGAFLAFALSWLFRADILKLIVHGRGIDITACTVSWPTAVAASGPCAITNLAGWPTLTFIDLIQTLIYLPLGLIILALIATLSGLGAAGGVDAPARAGAAPTAATRASSTAIAQDVTTTVVKTLRSAIDRRIRHLVRNIALSLRSVVWPIFILGAIYGLSEVSFGVRSYLSTQKSPLDALTLMGPAVLWGLGAALAVAFSAALLVFRWRVADNTLRFLGLIGFVLLLTFWLFSLALAGFNYLLNYTQVTQLKPFWPIGLTTAASFAALLLWGAYALLRRSRASAGGEAGELAPVGSSDSAGE